MMSQIGSLWRPARSPLAGLWSDAAGAVRSAMLTYFDRFANDVPLAGDIQGRRLRGPLGPRSGPIGPIVAPAPRARSDGRLNHTGCWPGRQKRTTTLGNGAPEPRSRSECQTEERDVRETL